MDRRKVGLALGMVAVLVLGGSGALAASPQPSPADDPCAGTATCSPADIAKLKEAAAKTETAKPADPGNDGSRCSADVKQGESPDPDRLAQALADALGVGLDQASAAMRELNLPNGKDGIAPDSPDFAAAAARLGVSVDRLQQALKAFKQANAPQDVKPSPTTTPGS